MHKCTDVQTVRGEGFTENPFTHAFTTAVGDYDAVAPAFRHFAGAFRGSRPPGEFRWGGHWAADCSQKKGAGPTLHRCEAFFGKAFTPNRLLYSDLRHRGEEVKEKNEKCLTCARMLTRERVARGARRVRMCARRKNGRELPTLPRAPTVKTRRCVWRGRGGHETVGRRCAAPRERSEEELAPLVLQCADARPDPHNTALFPFSGQIYHRT